jgi:hypothetical protein
MAELGMASKINSLALSKVPSAFLYNPKCNSPPPSLISFNQEREATEDKVKTLRNLEIRQKIQNNNH